VTPLADLDVLDSRGELKCIIRYLATMYFFFICISLACVLSVRFDHK